MKIYIKKTIGEGQIIPDYYGVAYRRMDMLQAVCYPIPLNIFVAVVYKVWLWLRWGHKLYENGYTKGYTEGKESGRKYAFNQYKKIALRGQIDGIIRRFLDEEKKYFSKPEKDQVGWIIKFMDEEEKRLYDRA